MVVTPRRDIAQRKDRAMTPKELPSIDEIRKHLAVDEDGVLYRNGNMLNIKPHRDGYLYVCVGGGQYPAHRISYALQSGEIPSTNEFVDHINGNKTDNRLSNLRLVSHNVNMKNQKRRNTNTSGYTGVRWIKGTNKWRVKIVVDYKDIHLGYFDELGDAIAARKKAEREKGFHVNHGRNDGHAG